MKMGRPREFDIDEALDRAMGVFWVKGYEGASLQDLLDAMQIARGSLYKAFQDKHRVYLAALDRYDRTVVQQVVEALRNPRGGDGIARIRRVLEGARDAVASRNDRRGCFMCNAAVDQAPADPEIRTKVMAMMKRLERAFGGALKESKQARSWSSRRRTATARLILNSYMGLRVLARSGYSAADLAGIIGACLQNWGLQAARRT
jgi:TetR/AcrR family transcriptional regulator, transcriptional repressor for nem operon